VQPPPGQAVSFGAEEQRDLPGVPQRARYRRRAFVRGEREGAEPGGLQLREAVEPAGHPGVRDGEHRTHRDLDRPPVQRVGAPRRQHDRVDAERGRAAEDRAHVAVVNQVFEHDDPARAGDDRGDTGQRLAGQRRQRAPVHPVPGEAFRDLVGNHVDGGGGHVQGRDVGQPALAEEHRAHGVAGRDGAGDDLRALRDEQAVLGLQVRPQARVRQPGVVGQPDVGGVVDLNGHAPSVHQSSADRGHSRPSTD
jgi:hypothetical protein